MRRAAIYLAILCVAGAVSVVAQGTKIQGGKAPSTERSEAARPEANAAVVAAAALAQDPTQYVGEAVCLTCHETQKYDGTLHALKSNDRTPAATHGCESCHGPGKGHVDGGGDATKIVTAQGDFTPGIERHLRDVPRPPHARVVGGEPARAAQCRLHHVPQRSYAEGSETACREDGARAVRDLPSQHRQQAAPPEPHARAGRRADVLLLPQPARLGEPPPVEDRHNDRRGLRELPRGEARTLSLGARAGREYLRHVPRSARLEQRSSARGQAAVPLPTLSRHVQASSHAVRRDRAEHFDERQQDFRPSVRRVPPANPRVERPVRPVLPSLERTGCVTDS